MINGIKGIIKDKEFSKISIDVNDIYYEINLTFRDINNLELGESKFLYISQKIKETDDILYGFLSKDDRLLFNELCNISGIGDKTALNICSMYNFNEFSEKILSNDIDAIKLIPGIGPKTAGRLMVELSDSKLFKNNLEDYILTVLTSSGFKKHLILKSLNKFFNKGIINSELLSSGYKFPVNLTNKDILLDAKLKNNLLRLIIMNINT